MRIFNNWNRSLGMWSFPLANIWWGNGVFGFSILALAFEWETPEAQEEREEVGIRR